MASIRDIAHSVGCSIATVSRVVNNRDAVDPETRKRVLAAIKKYDYRPNLTAQGLRSKRGRLIGIAIPTSTVGAFSVIVQYALDTAYKHDYNLVVVNTHEDPDLEENLIKDLLRRNINGVMLTRVSDESKIVKKIVKQNIPIVVIDRAFEHENVSNVVLDNQKAGYLAARHLLELGHEEIACITGALKITLCRERLKGFQGALADAGIGLPKSRIAEGNFLYESGIGCMERLSSAGEPLTAVWAMNDLMAFGALRVLQRKGRRVPEDVSVLGMDDLEIAEMVTPPLTSVHYPLKELVENAMELLIKQINTKETLTETIVLEPSMTIRSSTARCAELAHGAPGRH